MITDETHFDYDWGQQSKVKWGYAICQAVEANDQNRLKGLLAIQQFKFVYLNQLADRPLERAGWLDGVTANEIAARKDHADCLKLLLGGRGRVLRYSNAKRELWCSCAKGGYTPIEIAAKHGSVNCLRFLRDKGYKFHKRLYQRDMNENLVHDEGGRLILVRDNAIEIALLNNQKEALAFFAGIRIEEQLKRDGEVKSKYIFSEDDIAPDLVLTASNKALLQEIYESVATMLGEEEDGFITVSDDDTFLHEALPAIVVENAPQGAFLREPTQRTIPHVPRSNLNANASSSGGLPPVGPGRQSNC